MTQIRLVSSVHSKGLFSTPSLQISQRSLLYPALVRNSRGASVSMLRLKRMSMMRLKKDDADDADDADDGSQVDKRMSMMRLKKPSMMRLRRGPSMMRLKKDGSSGEERACLLMKGICFTLSDVSTRVVCEHVVASP
jgi:hypothetical protein